MSRNSVMILARTLFSRPTTTFFAVRSPCFHLFFTKTITISQSKPPIVFSSPRHLSSSSAVVNEVNLSTLLDTSRENAQGKLSTFVPPLTSTIIVSLKSEEALKIALKKAQDDRVPTFIYFASQGEIYRRTFSVIKELSEKYSHVTTYKADTYVYDFGDTLSKLQLEYMDFRQPDFEIGSMIIKPTISVYCNGEKKAEVVGHGDLADLRLTLDDLYKQV